MYVHLYIMTIFNKIYRYIFLISYKKVLPIKYKSCCQNYTTYKVGVICRNHKTLLKFSFVVIAIIIKSGMI